MDTTTNNNFVLDLDEQAGTPRIFIETVSGEITVTGWDRPQVVLSSDDADEDSDIADMFGVRKNGNEITVSVSHGGNRSRSRGRSSDGFGIDEMIRAASSAMRGVSADIEVKVPYNCDLELKTADGDISVTAVDGKISINSASGDISLNQVNGSVLAKSVSGEVEIEGFSGRLGARTMSGDISVTAGELVGLSIGTASGEVEVSGQLVSDGEYEIQSVSGDVDLMLPKDTRCLAEIQTVSGDIDCELPHDSQKNGKRRQKLLINGGDGAVLHVNTTSGDVQIGEWDGAPEQLQARPAMTRRLDATQAPAQPATEHGDSGQTVRMDTPVTVTGTANEMSILQAIENGELTVEEGLRRLNELSKSY